MVERIVSERLIDQGHPSMIGGTVLVSPDCRRVAYVARGGRKRFVVVDGQEQRQYDRVETGSLGFSPDGQRVAYVALTGKRYVAVDGQEVGQYDRVERGSLVFSHDSQRSGYVAGSGKKWFVVVDGIKGKQYDKIERGSLIFSPDSERGGYVAGSGKKWFVVEDGWEQKQFHGIETGSLIFSTDSQSLGYVAEGTNWERILIVDGQEKERYHAGLRRTIRSPNLRRVAYSETDGMPDPDDAVVPGRVVVDGQKSKWYDHGERVTLAFSPDSLRLAYAISGGRKWLVVVDGREGKQYDLIEGASLLFSPDSKHVAYVARRGGKWLVVVPFISTSVAAPTLITATPPESLATRSCSFSLS